MIKSVSMRNLTILGLLPLVAMAAACGSSSSHASSSQGGSSSGSGLTKSAIVIGNVGNYSGAAQFGPQWLQAEHSLDAWATFTNAHGGLNGHPVKIISKDDQNDLSTSLKAVKELVENDHAVAILSPMASGTSSAWASYVKSKGVPVIGGLPMVVQDNPDMLPLTTSVGFLTGQFVATKTYGTKVGVLTCAETSDCRAGLPLFKSIAAGAGLQYGGAQLVSASAVNYTAPCLAMKQAGVDVIAFELDGTTIKRIVDGCADQGYTPTAVVPAADLDAAALADPHFSGAVGITVSPLWFGTPTSTTKDWAETYSAQFAGTVPNGYATLGWQAGVVLAAALKNAPDTVTSQTILDGLDAQPADSTFGGWTAPVTFTKGKSSTPEPCVWLVQIKDKQFTAPKGDSAVCPAKS